MADAEPIVAPAKPAPETPAVKTADVGTKAPMPDVESIVKEGNPETKAEERANAEEDIKTSKLFTWRTALSALIYGAVGALVGRALGKWGDYAGQPVGSRLLPWVGGGLGVFLSAFTSMKTERRERIEAAEERRAAKLAGEQGIAPAVAPEAPATEKPAAHVDGAAHKGTVNTAAHTLAI